MTGLMRIWKAICRFACGRIERRRRLAAVARISRMGLPVADWPAMEQEIERGACGL